MSVWPFVALWVVFAVSLLGGLLLTVGRDPAATRVCGAWMPDGYCQWPPHSGNVHSAVDITKPATAPRGSSGVSR